LSMAVILVLHFLFSPYLWQQTLTFIPYIQQGASENT
jgi:hypothetical protein